MHRVRTHLDKQAGIADVRTNEATGSVLVHYDPKQHSTDDILAILDDVGVIVGDIARGSEEGLPGLDELSESTADGTAETVHTGDIGIVGPRDHSAAASTLVEAVDDLNTRVARYTGGVVDLKLLFPVSLGALGIYRVVRNGFELTEVPAYVLLWYAFDSFHKFHRPHVVHVTNSAQATQPEGSPAVTAAGTPETAPAPDASAAKRSLNGRG